MSENRPTSAVDLLQHASFVRAVAHAAVRGDHDVDDVVQETWLSTLRASPDEVRRPRGWLGAVVHRRAADVARSAGRRREREQAAARGEAVESTVDVVARAEISQRLARVVLELDEPYREAILLRYFDDLPPREIAARTGVPVETVRTRTRRGLERLRAALDAKHDGRRANWVASLLPLLPPGGASLGSATPGGLVVAKKKLAGLLAVVGGGMLALMDTISSPGEAGWYGLAGLLLAVLGLVLLLVNVVRLQGRRWSVGLLVVAIGYAGANVGAFLLAFSADRFAIFDRTYLVLSVIVAPALLLTTLLVGTAISRRPGWLGPLGLAIWTFAVAFIHFWIIAQASASV